MKVKQVLRAVQSILGHSPIIEPNQLVDQLIEAGFKIEEIESAFAFIYSVPEKINNAQEEIEPYFRKRVLSDYERIRLSNETWRYLHALLTCGLLSSLEFEKIICEVLSYDDTEIGIRDIQSAYHLVIDDPMRVALVVGSPGHFNN